MNNILLAVAVLGGSGAVFGLILAIASKAFEVKADPRIEPVTGALPGANCGGCGYSGCAGYARAIVEGGAPMNLCASGGNAAAQAIAAIMGAEAQTVERRVALVMCRGGYHARKKARYDGLHDCAAAMKVAGNGPALCAFGCLGFGNCVARCKYDAIHLVDGVARVDQDKCVGCMMCAAACPRHIIVPVPVHQDIVVACSNHERGADLRRYCEIGCLGCRVCEKACEHDAIHVENNLAVIDYAKCVSCGACAEKCPRHLISDANLWQEHDVVEAKTR